jgi:hypothetical protein
LSANQKRAPRHHRTRGWYRWINILHPLDKQWGFGSQRDQRDQEQKSVIERESEKSTSTFVEVFVLWSDRVFNDSMGGWGGWPNLLAFGALNDHAEAAPSFAVFEGRGISNVSRGIFSQSRIGTSGRNPQPLKTAKAGASAVLLLQAVKGRAGLPKAGLSGPPVLEWLPFSFETPQLRYNS